MVATIIFMIMIILPIENQSLHILKAIIKVKISNTTSFIIIIFLLIQMLLMIFGCFNHH